MATESNLSSHIYQRDLPGIGPDDSLRRLAEWIPAEATVLELGPATGYFTRYLAESLGCTVDAIELDPEMAERVRPLCRKLIVGDLADPGLLTALGTSRYGIIIAADIIEHLASPEPLIERLTQFLDTNGLLLLSVPNVAYAGVIADLLRGRFEYRDEGLLDRTHLRFYTRDSLSRLLEKSGFHVREWAAVFRPLNESEFKIRVETLPAEIRSALLDSPHALCYQWVAKAGLTPAGSVGEEPDSLRVDQFPVRIRIRVAEERDSSRVEEVVAWAYVGRERQTLRIVLPHATAGPMRLYLADRPGFMRIFGVSILSNDETIWSWRPVDGLKPLLSSHDGCSFSLSHDFLLATLHLPHAWITPDLGSVALAPGVVVSMDIGWPMSADFLVATQGWSRALAELAANTNSVQRVVAESAGGPGSKVVGRTFKRVSGLVSRWLKRFFSRAN